MIKTSSFDDKQQLAYRGVFRTSLRSIMVPFCENSQRLIAANQFRKSSIRDFPMGSKYAFGLSYGAKIGRYEFM